MSVAHYCLHKFHWKPSEFAALPMREKALVIASVQLKVEKEKKKLAEAETAAHRG